MIPCISDEDIAACFQDAVVDVLVSKLISAGQSQSLSRVVVTGGVAANGCLRKRVESATAENGMEAHFPKPVFCTDNAAMIACAGYHRYRRKNVQKSHNFHTLDAHASLPLDVSGDVG